MKFQIPFTFSGMEKLKLKSTFYLSWVKHKKDAKLSAFLINCDVNLTREQYISICLRNLIINFVALFIFITTFFIVLRVPLFFIWSFLLAIMFSGFILFTQINYPKIFVMHRQRDIEKNLISALQDILVQIDSGIPLFGVLVNVSSADYGELSVEFKKVVKKINAGSPEQEVLEEISKSNPSIYFRRTLWQISNGMNAGSDMGIVVRDSIKALNEEQLIQIQNYGNKLNPLIVFYMLMAVIVPALSITFLTVISSMVGLDSFTTALFFMGLFIFVVFLQIMFLGIIRSRRPSLL